MSLIKINVTICLLCFGLLCSNLSKGQLKVENFILSSSSEHTKFEGLPGYNSTGITFEAMLGKHFGLETGIRGGKDNMQIGGAAVSLPFIVLFGALLSENKPENDKLILPLLVGLVLSVEHMNYHINLSEKFRLTPNISLFRVRYMYDRYNTRFKNSWVTSGSAGLKLGYIHQNKWLFNFYGEGSHLYTSKSNGWQAGFSMGFIFD